MKENKPDKPDVNAKRYLLDSITKRKIELIEHVIRHNVKNIIAEGEIWRKRVRG